MSIRTLAAYFFFIEDREEYIFPQTQLSQEEIDANVKQAGEFFVACKELQVRLSNLIDRTEDGIQATIYDVGKESYGAEKKELRQWFRLLYYLLFGKESGVRLGTFVTIIGIDEFIDLLNRKLKNPFGT